jgi:hypothetical protein
VQQSVVVITNQINFFTNQVKVPIQTTLNAIQCLLLKPMGFKCVCIMENVIMQTEHMGEEKEKN